MILELVGLLPPLCCSIWVALLVGTGVVFCWGGKIERQTLSIEVGMQIQAGTALCQHFPLMSDTMCTECDRSLCGGKFIGIEMGQGKRSKKTVV